LIAAKWVANSPLVMVDQYVPSLKRYRAIALDVELKIHWLRNIDLDQALTTGRGAPVPGPAKETTRVVREI
jgi:hypothetical protein